MAKEINRERKRTKKNVRKQYGEEPINKDELSNKPSRPNNYIKTEPQEEKSYEKYETVEEGTDGFSKIVNNYQKNIDKIFTEYGVPVSDENQEKMDTKKKKYKTRGIGSVEETAREAIEKYSPDEDVFIKGKRYSRKEVFGEENDEPENKNYYRSMEEKARKAMGKYASPDYVFIGGIPYLRSEVFLDGENEEPKGEEEEEETWRDENVPLAEKRMMKAARNGMRQVNIDLQEKGLALEILNDNKMYLINKQGEKYQIPLSAKRDNSRYHANKYSKFKYDNVKDTIKSMVDKHYYDYYKGKTNLKKKKIINKLTKDMDIGVFFALRTIDEHIGKYKSEKRLDYTLLYLNESKRKPKESKKNYKKRLAEEKQEGLRNLGIDDVVYGFYHNENSKISHTLKLFFASLKSRKNLNAGIDIYAKSYLRGKKYLLKEKNETEVIEQPAVKEKKKEAKEIAQPVMAEEKKELKEVAQPVMAEKKEEPKEDKNSAPKIVKLKETKKKSKEPKMKKLKKEAKKSLPEDTKKKSTKKKVIIGALGLAGLLAFGLKCRSDFNELQNQNAKQETKIVKIDNDKILVDEEKKEQESIQAPENNVQVPDNSIQTPEHNVQAPENNVQAHEMVNFEDTIREALNIGVGSEFQMTEGKVAGASDGTGPIGNYKNTGTQNFTIDRIAVYGEDGSYLESFSNGETIAQIKAQYPNAKLVYHAKDVGWDMTDGNIENAAINRALSKLNLTMEQKADLVNGRTSGVIDKNSATLSKIRENIKQQHFNEIEDDWVL